LNAIKDGLVSTPYDGPFIFSEVNGDVVNWTMDATNKLGVHSLNKNRYVIIKQIKHTHTLTHTHTYIKNKCISLQL